MEENVRYIAPYLSLSLSHTYTLILIHHPTTDQRNMGMSMKIEKSTVDQVKQRFQFNKKKKEEEKKQYGETYYSSYVTHLISAHTRVQILSSG